MPLKAIFLAISCLFAATPIHAASIILSLQSPNQSAPAGSLLVFVGTYTNPTTEPFHLTGEIIDSQYPANQAGLFTFIGLRPLGLIIPPGTSLTLPIFSAAISPTVLPGLYSFSVFSDGLTASGAIDRSNTVPFTISVVASAVPESGSTILMLGVIVAILVVFRRSIRQGNS
jgi:hypothetical protein